MAYSPTTDFLALLRLTSAGAITERMPGLDWAVAALARAGLIALSVGQTPPTSNQATTAWFQPAQPSWTAEGTLFLWNAVTGTYQVATPALWAKLLTPAGYLFQSAVAGSNIVNAGVSVLAVQRAAPAATALVLPPLAAQWLTGRPLKIVDWSAPVVKHTITLTTPDGATIMQQVSWQMLSTAVQLAGITLHPVPELNGWIIAP